MRGSDGKRNLLFRKSQYEYAWLVFTTMTMSLKSNNNNCYDIRAYSCRKERQAMLKDKLVDFEYQPVSSFHIKPSSQNTLLNKYLPGSISYFFLKLPYYFVRHFYEEICHHSHTMWQFWVKAWTHIRCKRDATKMHIGRAAKKIDVL